MFAHSKTRCLCYLIPVALFLALVSRFWHPVYGFTSFLTLDTPSEFKRIPEVREFPVYVYDRPGSYDGQFYAQLAYHPLLNSPDVAPAMDTFPYRARRILPSMLAWALAGGQPALIFQAYCLLNILAWLALSAILWRLIEVRDARTWVAWLGVMFSAGAIFSVARALTDLVALAFMAGCLLLATRGRRIASALSLAAAALCRETALLAAIDFMAPRSDARESKGRGGVARSIMLGGIAAAPLILWCPYVAHTAGTSVQEWTNFTWPFRAYAGKWAASLATLGGPTDPILSITSLLTLVGLTLQGIYIAVTFDRANRWSRLGGVYLVLMAFLGSAVWDGLPGAACRVLLPMTLAFNLLAAQRKARLTWLLLGNMTVFSGLLFLKDVPYDDTEISTANRVTRAAIAYRGAGWYDTETSRSHLWLWTGKSGEFKIRCWPESTPFVTFTFKLRTVESTTVTMSADGHILREQLTNKDVIPVSLSVPVSQGLATLRFTSSGEPSISQGDPRPLNFQIYDPKVVLGTEAADSR